MNIKRYCMNGSGVDMVENAEGAYCNYSDIEKYLPMECEWSVENDLSLYASGCGVITLTRDSEFKFCPYCGGKITNPPTENEDD